MDVAPADNTHAKTPPKANEAPKNEKASKHVVQPEALAAKPVRKSTPQALAALTFIEQGRSLVKGNKPDDAIRVLERAMNLNPQNGKAYYYLAEAWLAKGNIRQATEYNRLAELYFKSNPDWGKKALKQKKTIQNR